MIPPFLIRALEQLAAAVRRDEPTPHLSVVLGGVSPETAAAVYTAVSKDLTRRAGDLLTHWQNIGTAVVGSLDPPAEHMHRAVVGSFTSLPDTNGTAALEETAGRLIGHEPHRLTPDGPIHGCECGADLKWGGSFAAHLAHVALGVPEEGTGVPVPPLSEQADTDNDETSGSWPGYTEIPAGQVTEFIGRQVVLPFREGLPRGPQILESAQFGNLPDGDQSPDVVMVKLAGLELPYALLPSDVLHVRTGR